MQLPGIGVAGKLAQEVLIARGLAVIRILVIETGSWKLLTTG